MLTQYRNDNIETLYTLKDASNNNELPMALNMKNVKQFIKEHYC